MAVSFDSTHGAAGSWKHFPGPKLVNLVFVECLGLTSWRGSPDRLGVIA